MRAIRLPLAVHLLATLTATSAPLLASGPGKTFTAFSLDQARRAIETGRGEQDAVRTLGHITRPIGLVVDRTSGDSILLGERDPSRPELRLDDLVTALRSVFLHPGDTAPGVSIDPRGDLRQATMQDVHYFGGVEGTRFGKVCYEADLLMKRIGLGLERVEAPGFVPYFALLERELRHSSDQARVGARFWFYPISARVVAAGDGVFLDRCEIVLLSEVLYAEAEGRSSGDVQAMAQRPMAAYADGFTKHLPELGDQYPVLRDLENLTHVVALARGLSKLDPPPPLQYWLREYRPAPVPTTHEVEVLVHEDPALHFRLQGGVYLHSLAVRLKAGDATALTALVLAARPQPDALMWSFALDRDWQVTVGSIPGEEDTSAALEYYAQADYLFRSRQYDLAIAFWRQVTRFHPDIADLYRHIALAFERKGLTEAAAEYYNRALQLDHSPQHPSARKETPAGGAEEQR